MCKFSPRKRIFWNIWFGDMLSQFNDFHLSKDSGKDKFSKGREEEKSPVETKDVDHLDENLPKKKYIKYEWWCSSPKLYVHLNLHPNVVLVLSILHKLATDLRASWAARLQESHDHLNYSVGLSITWLQRKTTWLNSIGVQESPSLLTLNVPLLNVNSQAALKKNNHTTPILLKTKLSRNRQ